MPSKAYFDGQSASAKPQQGASLTRGKQRMKLQHIIDGLPPAVQLAPLSPVRPLMRSDSEMIVSSVHPQWYDCT